MKKILFLLLVALLFLSCDRDEELRLAEVNTTFVINSQSEIDFIAVRINNSEGHAIHNYEYQNISELNLEITDGVEIMVYTVEPGYFDYDYTMYNSTGEIQFEGTEHGNTNHTILKQYQIQ